jgi:hypothetical protein
MAWGTTGGDGMFASDLPKYQVVWPLPELEANERWHI